MIPYRAMPLSKLWLLLLSLMCGLLVLLFVALEPELRRREADEQTQRLLRAQPVATQLLTNQAQQLVAAAVQMSSDALLETTLYEMGRGQSELQMLHETAQNELRQLGRSWNFLGGAALLLCTDARGRVLARIGNEEAVFKDPLDGFPLVEAALRGYRLDDLWLIDGTLYRVAASPIVGPNHDRYVGALVIGQVLGNDVVNLLGSMTGVDVMFLASGRVTASSLKSEPPDAQMLLAARTAGAAADGEKGELPKVVHGPQPGPDRLLSFVDMPGSAAQQGAVLVLAAEVSSGRTLPGLLRGAVQQLKAHGQPAQLVLALIGLLLLYSIGLGILRAESAVLMPATSPRAAPAVPAYIPPLPPSQPVIAPPPPPPQVIASPPPLSPPNLEREIVLPPPVSGRTASQIADTVVASPMLWEPEPEVAAPPEPRNSDDSTPPWRLPPPNSNFEPTLVANAKSESHDPDVSFYQVFQDYVLAREHCHESVEGLSYEQFRQRLAESRAQIMRQHGCRGVDFQVYIKENRAALRAIPLWK